MQFVKSYHMRLMEVLLANEQSIDSGIQRLLEMVLEVSGRKGSVWVIGNGGSASTAEHFETDMSYVRHQSIDVFCGVTALSSNSSLVSATANDTSYNDLYRILLKRKAKSGDLLISISASGNSPNIIGAIQEAKVMGVKTFSLLGFDGGRVLEISDYSLVVKTNLGEYGVVEDIHLSICHAVATNLLNKIST